MASIRDVARRAHVGSTTVSRVLSGKGYISDETRQRVLDAIDELNYVPNELARNLLHNKTNTIAVIIPDVSNFYFASLVKELEIALARHGYRTMLCNSFGRADNEAPCLNMLSRNMVDGVITASSLLDNASYAKIDRPIVSLDSDLAPHIPMVCSDHRTGGQAAARMLLEAGCRHVLQFRDSIDQTLHSGGQQDVDGLGLEAFPYTLRHSEFQRLAQEAGVQYDEYCVPMGTFGLEAFRRCAEEAFLRFPDVDGVLATDILALQYAGIAMVHGKKLPEELKVVAYDGTDVVRLFSPDVSAIVQPVADLARNAVELLVKRISGEPIENNRIVLPVQVVDKTKQEAVRL